MTGRAHWQPWELPPLLKALCVLRSQWHELYLWAYRVCRFSLFWSSKVGRELRETCWDSMLPEEKKILIYILQPFAMKWRCPQTKTKACAFSSSRLKSPLGNSNASVYLVMHVASNQDAGCQSRGDGRKWKNGDEKLRGKKAKFGG